MKKVITSKEQMPYMLAWEKYRDVATIEEKKDNIVWNFKSEDEAIRATRLFMNIGFEYVRRI